MRVTDSFFLVYGLEFLLSYVGAEATQKGRFYSEFTYFPSNFLYYCCCCGHGTRFGTMAILVKALKCVTKRLRAFP